MCISEQKNEKSFCNTTQHPGTLKRSKQSLGEYVLDPSLVFVCGWVWKGGENWAVSLSKEEELIWWKVETYHVASDIYLFRVKVRNTKELKRLKIWAKWVSCSSFCVVDVKSIWKKIVLCQIIVFSIYFILLRSLLGNNSHISVILPTFMQEILQDNFFSKQTPTLYLFHPITMFMWSSPIGQICEQIAENMRPCLQTNLILKELASFLMILLAY